MKNKHKVVQLGKYYPPFSGGIENNTQQLAEVLSEDYRSYVVCMRPSAGKAIIRRHNRIPLCELPSLGSVWRQQIVWSLSRILDRIDPDCIHFHAPNPILAYYLERYLKKRPHIKIVITHHADLERPEPIRKIANRGYYRLLERANWIIAYTEHAFLASREIYPYCYKKIIIPHGIRLPEKNKLGETSENSEKVSSDSQHITVGFLGRLESWKGVHILLQAARDLTDLKLRIAGEGSRKSDLKRMAEHMNMATRVEFLGNISGADKREFLDGLDVLVLPSQHKGETFGQCLVEAQLAGAAVIASDLPTGIQAIVNHGKTGLLVPPGNIDGLRDALESMGNEDYRRELAKQGQAHAERNFSQEIVAQEIKKFYKEKVFGNAGT